MTYEYQVVCAFGCCSSVFGTFEGADEERVKRDRVKARWCDGNVHEVERREVGPWEQFA